VDTGEADDAEPPDDATAIARVVEILGATGEAAS
jgi:ribosomal protein S28E/S33